MILHAFMALCFVLVVTPIARRLAIKIGFVDTPGGRKRHDEPVPPIGGLVIFAGFFIALLYDYTHIHAYWPLLSGLILLIGVGAVDDYAHIPPWPKFATQFIAASLIVLAGDARVYQLGNLFGFGPVGLDWVSIPFSIVAAVLLINAINLMDGLDGLAGGYSFLSLLWMALACLTLEQPEHLNLLFILMGGIAGFLFYNMRSPVRSRAVVFLGDAGSMALGLCLAWFAMQLSQEHIRVIEPISIAWILAIPIMDTCAQFYRRIRNKHHPFSPDRGHFHHHFIDAGISKGQASVLILTIGFILGSVGFNGAYLGVPLYILTFWWIVLLFAHMGISYRPERYKRWVERIFAPKS